MPAATDLDPSLTIACERGMSDHVAGLLPDIALAKQRYAADAAWTVDSIGDFIQSVLQGSFVFAKARQSAEVARQNLAHLRRYLVLLFPRPRKRTA